MADLIYDYIQVRYGELSTKGKNRKDFINKLVDNIRKRLSEYPNLKYRGLHDALFIELNGENYEEIKPKLLEVFGYSSFSGVVRANKDIKDIIEVVLKLLENKENQTFKVNTRRSDKSFNMKSDEINREVAGAILRQDKLKVDVHNPDIMIYINIKNDYAYITLEKIIGLGGYPTGVNGKALGMLSGGIDSPVAINLAQKRGLKVEGIHFASTPYTSKQARSKVIELCKILSHYQNDFKLIIIPFTDLQLAIYQNVPESYAITIMRRMMYRICEKVMRQRKCLVLINGESVGQVASQTLESLSVINSVTSVPVIRPVSCLDKLEIIDLSRKVGTYDISILPYEDCCTIFLPKHPVIHPDLEKAVLYEKSFSYEDLIDEAISSMQDVKINSTSSKFNF